MAERKQRKTKRELESHEEDVSNIIEIEEGQRRRKEKRNEPGKSEKIKRRREKVREKKARPKITTGKKLAVAGVLVVAVLIFVYNGYRIIDLNLDKAVFEKEYEEKLAEKARLERELSLTDDPEYVEQQARDRFHMLRDGELLYVFPEKEAVDPL